MAAAPDFYFDTISQVRVERWWRGRVALVGDAGYCGSPLAGLGTSTSILGGYVLAGELAATPDDHEGRSRATRTRCATTWPPAWRYRPAASTRSRRGHG